MGLLNCGFGSKCLPFKMIHIFSGETITNEQYTGCFEVRFIRMYAKVASFILQFYDHLCFWE